MGELLDRAVDPQQYDRVDTGWLEEGGLGLASPTRAHFWEYIEPFTHTWPHRDFLDIGAGTGWMVALAAQRGAKSAIGIEPSRGNIDLGRFYFPQATLIQATLEDFVPPHQFDIAASIMSLVHMRDLHQSFQAISNLLRGHGELLAVIPDYNHFKNPRRGYELEIEHLGDDEYVVKKKSETGTIADIVRQNALYQEAADRAGLTLADQMPMPPTEGLMQKAPKYRSSTGVSITHLLRFVKQ